MTNPSNPTPEEAATDPLDETLVAYLDGQLDAADCEGVEARLASDPQFRSRLTELDRVWNALDTLPRPSASAAFTRTTVDMAAVSAGPGAEDRTGVFRSWAHVWGAAIAGLAAGALITAILATAPERALLADLTTALHAHALEQAGSVEFLRRLPEEAPRVAAAFDDDSLEATRWADLHDASTPERRRWVEQQPPASLATVNDSLAAWNGATDSHRDSLRDLADQIAAAPDGAELRQTALAYDALVRRLDAADQSKLRRLPLDDRLNEVRRQADRWVLRSRLDLSDTEKAALRRAADTIVTSPSFKSAIALIETRRPGDYLRLRSRPEAALRMAAWLVSSRGDGSVLGSRFAEELAQRWPEWSRDLYAALPSDTQAVLDAAPNDAARARMLHALLRSAARLDLATAFAELDDRQMERRLLEPEDQFLDGLGPEEELLGRGDNRGGPSWDRGRRGPGGFDGRRGGLPLGPPPGPPRSPRDGPPPPGGPRFGPPQG